jgi:hypothetical protein
MDMLDINVNGVHLVNVGFVPLLKQGTKKTVITM